MRQTGTDFMIVFWRESFLPDAKAKAVT